MCKNDECQMDNDWTDTGEEDFNANQLTQQYKQGIHKFRDGWNGSIEDWIGRVT
jgi:hypothetical protein